MGYDKQSEIRHPMARSERLVIQNVGDEIVAYDEDTKTAHALKPLAAAVFTYADGKNTPAEIAELAAYRLDRPVTVADVNAAVGELDGCGLLETGQAGFQEHGISRRTALKAFAATGAGAMLVSSVAAPAAFAGTTGNGKPYSCGTYDSPIEAYNGYTLNPNEPGGSPQADTTQWNKPGSPLSAADEHLGGKCVVAPKSGSCGCTWSVNGTSYTNSSLSDSECTSGFCVNGGTVESHYTTQAECEVGVCVVEDNSNGNQGTYLQGITEKSQCPVGNSSMCSYNSGMKGICYSYDSSTNLSTFLGEVPTGTSNPGSYCRTNFGSSAQWQGCTSGYEWKSKNYDWVTGTPNDQQITGTYQCVPCDGSLGYQCCEVVCVPLTGGSPTYVQGAITSSSDPIPDSNGYGIYNTKYTGFGWGSYPNKWCTSNPKCNSGSTSACS